MHKFYRVCLSLDSETFQLLCKFSALQGVSKSQFVRLLLTGEKQVIFDSTDFKICDLSTKKKSFKNPFSY